jgi:hypothetical protein
MAAAAVLLAVTVLIAAVLLRPASPPDSPVAVVPNAQSPEPTSSAPPAEIERLHDALHDLGDQCEPVRSDRSKPSIDRDVATILAFARRYPEGRFPIDDETGSVLSLLLVARDTLRPCEPAAAARVNRALPSEFRDPKITR